MLLAAASAGQAIVTKVEAGTVFGVAGLTCERGIKIAVRINFVGSQPPTTFDEGPKL